MEVSDAGIQTVSGAPSRVLRTDKVGSLCLQVSSALWKVFAGLSQHDVCLDHLDSV